MSLPLRAFAFEMSEAKRQFCHEDERSLAGHLFAGAWSTLASGVAVADVCAFVTAAAIASVGLGALRLATLRSMLTDKAEYDSIVIRAFDSGCPDVPEAYRDVLMRALREVPSSSGALPSFVAPLLRQPRAGATAPGKPRLTLLPQENHGEHCLAVAVLGAIIAAQNGADPARTFLAGLAHHLHNARLPDTGFAGEMLLGDALEPLVQRLTDSELSTLATPLRAHVANALRLVGDAESADGRAFNAADVIDRVVQQHSHERALRFSARHALDELNIVHEGPMQSFGIAVLREHDLL